MRIDLEFFESHTPVFIAGINLGTKLYAGPEQNKKNKGSELITLWHETDSNTTFILCRNKVGFVNSTGVGTLLNPTQIGLEVMNTPTKTVVAPPQVPVGFVKAQASGPGLGMLKQSAQVETPIQKVQGTPGRKPKFQGQEAPE